MPRASSASSPRNSPGTRQHSLRGAIGPVKDVLRNHGWIRLLSALWVAIGAGGTVYAFVMTTQTCNSACVNDTFLFPQWTGEPAVIILVGALAAAVWILLAVPLLVAGLMRLRGWRPRNWLRAAALAGMWIAGFALMSLAIFSALAWQDGPGGANVAWGELPVFAAWLALGAGMTHVLDLPRQVQARRQLRIK